MSLPKRGQVTQLALCNRFLIYQPLRMFHREAIGSFITELESKRKWKRRGCRRHSSAVENYTGSLTKGRDQLLRNWGSLSSGRSLSQFWFYKMTRFLGISSYYYRQLSYLEIS